MKNLRLIELADIITNNDMVEDFFSYFLNENPVVGNVELSIIGTSMILDTILASKDTIYLEDPTINYLK